MEQFEFYDQIPNERRQAIILGLDQQETTAMAGNQTVNIPKICALIVEWNQQGKMPNDDKSIEQYRELVKSSVNYQSKDTLEINRLQDVDPTTFDDIMYHIITGLAGDSAFDEYGIITLSGLCNYVNSKLKASNTLNKNLLSLPTRDLDKIIIRKHPENHKKSIIELLNNFYDYLKTQRINGFVNAVDALRTLQSLGVRKVFLDTLQSEFTFCLKRNYGFLTKKWDLDYFTQVMDRLNQLIIDNQETRPQYAGELRSLRSTLASRFKNLNKYLNYNEFIKLSTVESLVFIGICNILDLDNLRSKHINYPEEDPIKSLINNFFVSHTGLDVGNLQKRDPQI